MEILPHPALLYTKEQIRATQEDLPIYVFNPQELNKNCQAFLDYFPGTTLYAVKTNMDPLILKAIREAGINHFDVASLEEIKLVRELFPDSQLFFMNPVKSESAIKKAYEDYQVKAFVLDADWELEKILAATNYAKDLILFVRFKVDGSGSVINLNTKYGLTQQEAVELVKRIKELGNQTGICFHVGTQCQDASKFSKSIGQACEIIKAVGFEVDYLDVGGGFPVSADKSQQIPLLLEFFTAINEALAVNRIPKSTKILCEPGRALVANAESLIVKVLGKKGNYLYLNDGFFGGLSELTFAIPFSVKALPVRRRKFSNNQVEFYFYGPTCDSNDFINRSFYLPEDIKIGDLIEIDQVGAYSRVFRSNFNGFYSSKTVVLEEDSSVAVKAAQLL